MTRLVIGNLRVQRIDRRDGLRSWTVVSGFGLVLLRAGLPTPTDAAQLASLVSAGATRGRRVPLAAGRWPGSPKT